jgi:hypothetical protein
LDWEMSGLDWEMSGLNWEMSVLDWEMSVTHRRGPRVHRRGWRRYLPVHDCCMIVAWFLHDCCMITAVQIHCKNTYIAWVCRMNAWYNHTSLPAGYQHWYNRHRMFCMESVWLLAGVVAYPPAEQQPKDEQRDIYMHIYTLCMNIPLRGLLRTLQ